MNRKNRENLSRRDFIQLSAAGFGALSLRAYDGILKLDQLSNSKLGRITVGKVDLKARPDIDSTTVGARYQDEVIPWLREVVGKNPFRSNQRWIEIPDGYLWANLSIIFPLNHLRFYLVQVWAQACGLKSACLVLT